jgi:NAD(P)-dependent dehydrogenase (short-subunit alcohol dehydrogenase family)
MEGRRPGRGHDGPGLDVEDLQFERKPYNGVIAYAQAKRAQVILTELWAEKPVGSGITVNAMHLGWADSGDSKRCSVISQNGIIS